MGELVSQKEKKQEHFVDINETQKDLDNIRNYRSQKTYKKKVLHRMKADYQLKRLAVKNELLAKQLDQQKPPLPTKKPQFFEQRYKLIKARHPLIDVRE